MTGRSRYATPEQLDLALRILGRHVRGERGDVTRPLARAVLRDLDRARRKLQRALAGIEREKALLLREPFTAERNRQMEALEHQAETIWERLKDE